jgi:hypothetical protein
VRGTVWALVTSNRFIVGRLTDRALRLCELLRGCRRLSTTEATRMAETAAHQPCRRRRHQRDARLGVLPKRHLREVFWGQGTVNALEALSAEASGDWQLSSKPPAQLPTPWVTSATPTIAKMAARIFRR